MSCKKSALFAGVLLSLSSAVLAGGSSTGSLNVKLSVTTGCDINGGGGIGAGTGQAAELDFGSAAVGATPAGTTPGAGSTALVVTCSGVQTPSLSFDGGQNAVGAQRNMRSLTNTTVPMIAYNLGTTVGGSEYAINTAVPEATAFTAGEARVISVKGSLTGAIQAGAEGQYTDVVQILMTF